MTSRQDLPIVAETLLIPLNARAQESARPDALIRDAKAQEIVARMGPEVRGTKPNAEDRVMIALRALRFNHHARSFLQTWPSGTIVEIGSGLDARYSRVDNGQVRWFDLDLPEVIDLRRRFFAESDRCQLLAGSVLSAEWIGRVPKAGGPTLFLAEGVFPYFNPEEVRRCILMLRDAFPGCEMVFDGMSPLLLRLHNLQLIGRKMRARLRWAMRSPRDLEAWGDDVRLLQEWYYFTDRQPRLGLAMWMGHVPILARASGVYHYQLGRLPAATP